MNLQKGRAYLIPNIDGRDYLEEDVFLFYEKDESDICMFVNIDHQGYPDIRHVEEINVKEMDPRGHPCVDWMEPMPRSWWEEDAEKMIFIMDQLKMIVKKMKGKAERSAAFAPNSMAKPENSSLSCITNEGQSAAFDIHCPIQ